MLQGNDDYLSVERVAEERHKVDEALEDEIDSPVDQVIDQIVKRANDLGERIPRTSRDFAMVVAKIARETLTLKSISGIIFQFIEHEILVIRLQVLRATLSVIQEYSNPHMTIDILAFVSGMSSEKEVSIGRRHGVERATISKRAIILKKKLGIHSGQMRKESVCETYRNRELRTIHDARNRLASLL